MRESVINLIWHLYLLYVQSPWDQANLALFRGLWNIDGGPATHPAELFPDWLWPFVGYLLFLIDSLTR